MEAPCLRPEIPDLDSLGEPRPVLEAGALRVACALLPKQGPEATSPTDEPERPLRVGCALLPKKINRYLTPSMKAVALSQGVELCLIDYGRSLQDQGPFDAIIHKLGPNQDWQKNLLDYCKQHPSVAIIDRVDGIRTLQNRSTMLNALDGEGVVIKSVSSSHRGARVQAPHQVEIAEGTGLAEAQQMLASAGLHPPLLVKPLWTDGREGSHGLAVLHDLGSLDRILSRKVSTELQPPLVVQQFVEHGGVLFKVYVLGDRTVVSKRPSLGDKYLGKEAQRKGLLQLPRISCKSGYYPTGSTPPQPPPPQPPLPPAAAPQEQPGSNMSAAPVCPPQWVMHALAGVLRERLGLQLFNFDLICPEDQLHNSECLYYVIDINYFPGVDKIANFEHVFIDFLKTATLQHAGSQKQQHVKDGVPGVMAAGLSISGSSSQSSSHTDPMLAS